MPSLPPPNPGLYDEMFDGATPRPHCAAYADWLHGLSDEALSARQREADLLFRRHGVTFTLRDNLALDRHIPFDIVRRAFCPRDWRGARPCQRLAALNAFLHDIYHDRVTSLRAGVIPPRAGADQPQYQVAMHGLDLPNRVYAHVAGVDLARHSDGAFYVLEDNLRAVRRQLYAGKPQDDAPLVSRAVRPAGHRPGGALRQPAADTLREASPVAQPTVVVLTPAGITRLILEYAFLARQMGVELVEGQDLFVPKRPGGCAPPPARRRWMCDLPAHRRRVSGPAGVQPRFAAGRARPVVGVPFGPGWRCAMRPAPGRPDDKRFTPMCRT